MKLILLTLSVIAFSLSSRHVHAETFKSAEYSIQTKITPTPTPFKPIVQVGFAASQNAKPLRIFGSTDLVDYGPITPTNPIKRMINISVDAGSSPGYRLFIFQDHPLQSNEHTIPDTSCDDGSCDERRTSPWVNPFTFGLGYSFDDQNYQQFPDISKKESMRAITHREIMVKLNVAQNQHLVEDTLYENTITFLLLPKF